jgi:DnaJ-class molecular chaperone
MKACSRCYGSGMAPSDPKGRYCRDCFGTGVVGKEFNYRSDGRVERVCEHGIGHTVSIRAVDRPSESWWAHGCDGCCGSYDRYS